MTKRILVRPRASQDLDDRFAYIAENNLAVALQFFDSTRLTIAQLARMQGIGSLYPVKKTHLQGLQKWAVKDFRKYLVLYIERDDEIEVVRILYATQDINSVLQGKE